MRRLLVATVFLIPVAIIALLAFTPSILATVKTNNIAPLVTSDGDKPDSSGCGGIERWSIKVFTDTAAHAIDFTPKPTSITHLCSIDTPAISINMPRFDSIEDSTYTVVCNILEKLNESDSDYHLVITDGIDTMIGEIPDPNCYSVSISPKVNEFIACRHWVDSAIGKGTYTHISIAPVQITGVAFLDPPHNQTGKARNNMELHSIIDIRFAKTTSVQDYELAEKLMIFPNPNTGEFTVKMPQGGNKVWIEIYDVFGRIIKTEQVAEYRIIDMKSVPKGMYLYKILTENRALLKTGKLIIE